LLKHKIAKIHQRTVAKHIGRQFTGCSGQLSFGAHPHTEGGCVEQRIIPGSEFEEDLGGDLLAVYQDRYSKPKDTDPKLN
jgi:hypothetical protein